MIIENKLDTSVFGDEEDWCVDYLQVQDFVEDSHEGLVFVQKKVEKILQAIDIFSGFGLCFDFEGDSGPSSQASLAYMKRIGESGILYFVEISENHYMLCAS